MNILKQDKKKIHYHYAIPGHNITIACYRENNSTDEIIHNWRHLSDSKEPAIDESRFNKKNETLVISRVKPEDAGEYQCQFQGASSGKLESTTTHNYIYVVKYPLHLIKIWFTSNETCTDTKKGEYRHKLKKDICTTKKKGHVIKMPGFHMECNHTGVMRGRVDVLVAGIKFTNNSDCNVKCVENKTHVEISKHYQHILNKMVSVFKNIRKSTLFKEIVASCSAGYELFASSLCVPCNPGFFNNGKAKCGPCLAGTYQHSYGASSCLECPPTGYDVAGCTIVHETYYSMIWAGLFATGCLIVFWQAFREILRWKKLRKGVKT